MADKQVNNRLRGYCVMQPEVKRELLPKIKPATRTYRNARRVDSGKRGEVVEAFKA
jgi:hypothetical protein